MLMVTHFPLEHPHHHDPCLPLLGIHMQVACSLRLLTFYTAAPRCQLATLTNCSTYGLNRWKTVRTHLSDRMRNSMTPWMPHGMVTPCGHALRFPTMGRQPPILPLGNWMNGKSSI